jgi:hypothetical protein
MRTWALFICKFGSKGALIVFQRYYKEGSKSVKKALQMWQKSFEDININGMN